MQIFWKYFFALLLCAGLFLGVRDVAKGQAIVNDPAHMAANVVNFSTEIHQTLSTMGFTEENLAIMKDISDYAQKAFDLMQDINAFKAMGNSLYNMYAMADYYTRRIAAMKTDGVDPYVFTRLARQVVYSLNSIKNMYEQALKILSDRGLEFAQKLQMSRELTKQIDRQTQKNIDDMERELSLINDAIAYDEFDTFLYGKDKKTSVDIVNGDLQSAAQAAANNVKENYDGNFDSDVNLTISGGLRVVLILLGFLLAVWLVFIMVRYMRGSPGSEGAFSKVFVVIVVAVTVLTVLTKMFTVS